MQLKLKKINAVQAANFLALIYIPFGLLYVAIGGIMFAVGEKEGIMFIVMGVAMPLFSWPFCWIGTLIANLALKITKGIGYTVEKVTK